MFLNGNGSGSDSESGSVVSAGWVDEQAGSVEQAGSLPVLEVAE